MEFQENKALMGIVALLLVLFAVSIYFYSGTLNQLAAVSCTDSPQNCPHEKIVDTQNIVIAALVLLIVAIAIAFGYSAMQRDRGKKARQHESTDAKEAVEAPATVEAPVTIVKSGRKIDVSVLSLDERKVMEILDEGSGSVFQSDILRKTGYSKVKVSRLLDGMEQKGLLERKRRGMANLVVLK